MFVKNIDFHIKTKKNVYFEKKNEMINVINFIVRENNFGK